jgi:hypothetical protein
MECPICYEEFGHAPHCPVGIEIEVDEHEEERAEAVKQIKDKKKAKNKLVCTCEKRNISGVGMVLVSTGDCPVHPR